MVVRSTHDRPREKLLKRGVGALTSRELIQLILGSGSQEMPIERLARRITKVVDREKGMLSVEQLIAVKGIGAAKAAQIVAALELARRLNRRAALSPKQVANSVEDYFIQGSQLVYILFDGSGQSVDHRVVEIGSLPVTGRTILRDIIESQAVGLYVAAKVPTIDVSVLEIMRMIHLAGEWLGITIHGAEVLTDSGRESI